MPTQEQYPTWDPGTVLDRECQVKEITPGGLFHVVIPDGGVLISDFTTLRAVFPLDVLAYGIHVAAFYDNAGVPTATDNFAINMVDSFTQQSIVYTEGRDQFQGQVVPVSLWMGEASGPHMWAQPRPFYQNSTLSVSVRTGVTLCYLVITIMCERFDRIRSTDKILRACGDPRITGYTALSFDPLILPPANEVNPCARGQEVSTYMRLETLPYDVIITSISAILVDDGDATLEYKPIAATGAQMPFCEFGLTDLTTKSETSTELVPLSFYNGQIFVNDDADMSRLVRPVSMPLPILWRIPQQSAIELTGRSVITPTGLTGNMTLRVVLHGFRVPSEEEPLGFPYHNRLDGSQACPPRSLDSTGVYRLPGSPIPYPASMPYRNVVPPPYTQPCQQPYPQNGQTVMRNPADGRLFYPGFPSDPRYVQQPPCPPGTQRGG